MELVLIRGLPGSGKTTMGRILALVGYEHHEADQYFEKNGKYRFDKLKLSKAHEWCLDRTKDSMRRRSKCVVSNTFSQRWEIKPYIDAANAHGYSVRVIEASGEFGNIHGVPDEVITAMRARWESTEFCLAPR